MPSHLRPGRIPGQPDHLMDRHYVPPEPTIRGKPQPDPGSRDKLLGAIRAKGEEPQYLAPRTDLVDIPFAAELSGLLDDPVFGGTMTKIAERAGPAIALGCAYVFMGYTAREAYRLTHHRTIEGKSLVSGEEMEFVSLVNFWKMTLVSKYAPHRLKLLSQATAILEDRETSRELRWAIVRYFISLEHSAALAQNQGVSPQTIYNQLFLASESELGNKITEAILAKPSLLLEAQADRVIEGQAEVLDLDDSDDDDSQ